MKLTGIRFEMVGSALNVGVFPNNYLSLFETGDEVIIVSLYTVFQVPNMKT